MSASPSFRRPLAMRPKPVLAREGNRARAGEGNYHFNLGTAYNGCTGPRMPSVSSNGAIQCDLGSYVLLPTRHVLRGNG